MVRNIVPTMYRNSVDGVDCYSLVRYYLQILRLHRFDKKLYKLMTMVLKLIFNVEDYGDQTFN
jgi:hypothetical protein